MKPKKLPRKSKNSRPRKPDAVPFMDRFEQHAFGREKTLSGDRVFVACSGGPDSVALLHLLLSCKKKWKLKIGLLHFNHRLRGKESDQDEAFVKRLGKRYKLPVYCDRGQVLKLARRDRESLEEAARKARYGFFIQAAKQYRIGKILLAHTQDDQAETVMMRVLQGTGLRGLSGIRERIKIGNTVLMRPLLPFAKRDILKFLKDRNIAYRVDSSNQSNRFLRNRIRQKLLPWLTRQFNPQAVAALARIPAIVHDENDLMNELAEKAWKKAFKKDSQFKVELHRKTFLHIPSPLQFRVIEKSLKRLDPRSGLNFDAWQRLKVNLTRPRFQYSLPRDIDFSLTPLKLIIYKKFN